MFINNFLMQFFCKTFHFLINIIYLCALNLYNSLMYGHLQAA